MYGFFFSLFILSKTVILTEQVNLLYCQVSISFENFGLWWLALFNNAIIV